MQKLHQSFFHSLNPTTIGTFYPRCRYISTSPNKKSFQMYCLQVLTMCHGFIRSLVSIVSVGIGMRQVNVYGGLREKTKMKLDQPVSRWVQDAFISIWIKKKKYDYNEVWNHPGKNKKNQWEKTAENKPGNEVKRINFEIQVLEKKWPSIFFAGQVSERGSLVTSASEEILEMTWSNSKKQMGMDWEQNSAESRIPCTPS